MVQAFARKMLLNGIADAVPALQRGVVAPSRERAGSVRSDQLER
jgi:hypothetical protein